MLCSIIYIILIRIKEERGVIPGPLQLMKTSNFNHTGAHSLENWSNADQLSAS